ncbi:PhzF family phenazine biosynthesis protein [Bacillus solimangrovi]|uniref:Isomerase n=1 Tax=Bacillus solimangrovi TaxID=1305675 RepID=A0A1E5LHV2_9BACI|nr:PhzF family phenazine biosynthesis protein [Bacillus solimangrovi]OEH93641.1 isomerase [Bacillus solimangrovi]
MKSVNVFHYDAFSNEPNKGNPAGVVLNTDSLTDKQMQEIALKVGFNETTFPVKSDVADIRLRYFTPGHEMSLCGHGTVSTIYALASKGILNKEEITIETRAGILPIKLDRKDDEHINITMKQANPKFEQFNEAIDELAKSIGLMKDDLDLDLPIVYGSTGTWTLVIPIKELSAFKRMEPNNKLFPSILKEMPNASIHPFCLETDDETADMHARHFSSPYSGTVEDPVTGTASGVLGAYYATYINNNDDEKLNLLVEQGHEIGKKGQVKVAVSKQENDYEVEITGSAVYVKEFEVQVEE